ncbi:hypothetical protein L579_0013 [Pantoea sp. AS-PWVM4]|nr:hypothetical protein L579_0013 [Pantoea sp. AS-PWVM4]
MAASSEGTFRSGAIYRAGLQFARKIAPLRMNANTLTSDNHYSTRLPF